MDQRDGIAGSETPFRVKVYKSANFKILNISLSQQHNVARKFNKYLISFNYLFYVILRLFFFCI